MLLTAVGPFRGWEHAGRAGGQDCDPPESFGTWWTTGVAQTHKGVPFSRQDLVLAAAQKEGGVHVDRRRARACQLLVVENGLGWFKLSPPPVTPVGGNPLLASVRQITYEVEVTLHDQLPQLILGFEVSQGD